jgi:transcriptional antiterminator NusG
VSELDDERAEAISEEEAQEAAAEAESLDSEQQAETTDEAEVSPTPEELEQGEGVDTLAEVSPVEPGQVAEMKGDLVETEEEREEEEEEQEEDELAEAAEEIGEPEDEVEIVTLEEEAEEEEGGPAEEESAAEQEEDIEELEDQNLEAEELAAEEQEEAEPEAEPEAELEAEAAEPAVIEEPDDGRHWYVVHCYSGYENKVRHNLEQRIETMGMKSKIFDVVVPTEEEIEVKDGKRRTVERRVFPGYILVQMLMDEDSWYVVRNTPGVTGFVGMGNEPTPLRPEEVSQIVKRMEAEAPRIKVTYKTGQKVRIIDGPFNDFIGTVSDIDMERAKVRVMVSFFGRETPVELDFLQVEKA